MHQSAKSRFKSALLNSVGSGSREFWALNNVTFDIFRGEIVGILGRNGSGKSTLLQVICSIMKATSGSVEVQGRIASLLELGAGFNPELTGRENVFLNAALMMIPERETRESIDDIRTFADIGEYFDQPVKHYSSGMFARLAFSSAIHVNPDVFIVDEALSVGDAGFQNRCFEKIQNFISQGKNNAFCFSQY